MDKKTPLNRMRTVNEVYGNEPEAAHIRADELLCSLVREFVPNGSEVVKEYLKIKKWYA